MAQVWLGSGLRRVRVPNPRKSFVAASVCVFTWSRCVPFRRLIIYKYFNMSRFSLDGSSLAGIRSA